MDAAASVQKVCEEVMVKLARYAKAITGSDHLVLAGGCALNCVANGLIVKEGIFDDVFVQPAAGDAGGALGAALHTWYDYLDNPRTPERRDSQKGSYLGPQYQEKDIETYLQSAGAKYTKYSNDDLPN